MIQTGSQVPTFNVPNHTREMVSSDALKGKKYVLAFFPAAFTSVCEKELCTFRDALAKFNDMQAQVFGVSVDAPFANAAFAQKTSLNFPILSDYSRQMVQGFGIAHDDFAGMAGLTVAKRAVFVVNAEGTVTYAWVAPNPGVEPNYAEVQAAVANS